MKPKPLSHKDRRLLAGNVSGPEISSSRRGVGGRGYFPRGKVRMDGDPHSGHTRGICLYNLDHGVCLTGTPCLSGPSVERTDQWLPWPQLFHSIERKLLVTPDKTEIFPGHNLGRPTSTIGHERVFNPFLNGSLPGTSFRHSEKYLTFGRFSALKSLTITQKEVV